MFHPELTRRNKLFFHYNSSNCSMLNLRINQSPPTSAPSILQIWLRCSKCLMAAASRENCSCGGTIFSSTTKPFPERQGQEPWDRPRTGRPETPSNAVKETGWCQSEGKSAWQWWKLRLWNFILYAVSLSFSFSQSCVQNEHGTSTVPRQVRFRYFGGRF